MAFNYSELKKLIIYKCGTLTYFAELMEIVPSTASALLTNEKAWSQPLIVKACKVLNIKEQDIGKYFYQYESE